MSNEAFSSFIIGFVSFLPRKLTIGIDIKIARKNMLISTI